MSWTAESLLKNVFAQYMAPYQITELSREIKLSSPRRYQGEFLPGGLYVALGSELPQALSQEQLPVAIICIADEGTDRIPAYYQHEPGVMLLLLKNTITPEAAMDLLDSALDGCGEWNSILSETGIFQGLLMAASCGDLHEFIAKSAELLGCSCAIVGKDAKIVCSFSPGAVATEDWCRMEEAGRYSNSNLLQQIREKGVYQCKGNQMSRIVLPDAAPGMLVVPLFRRKQVLELCGYLLLEVQRPDGIGRYFWGKVAFICDVLIGIFARFPVVNTASDILLPNLLEGILTGAITTDAAIEGFIKHIHFRSLRYHIVLVVAPREFNSEKSAKHMLRYGTAFSDIWNVSHSLLFDQGIVILVSDQEENLLDKDHLKRFEECLQRLGLVAGISDIFDEIDIYFSNYYARARAALDMARKIFGYPMHYAEYRDVILYYCIRHGMALDTHHLINPQVLKLHEYDRRHNTEFLMTLRYFWLCDKNTDRTCNMLHIHRNTLFYRLGKIRELTMLDLSSSASFLDLNMSFALAVRQGTLPFLAPPRDN